MFHFFSGKGARLIAFGLLWIATQALGQKTKYNIDRCSAVNRAKPVNNIVCSEDNVKLVGSGQEYFQVRACNSGTLAVMEPGELSVLSFFGGNTDFRWNSALMLTEARGATDITCAWYDAKNDWLWIGTKASGLLQFKTKPALSLIDQITTANSKIKSNEISCIFQDAGGRYWIGSREGLLVGMPKKWKNELDGYHIQRIRASGPNFYILADSEFWFVQSDRFKPVAIDEKALDGEAVDFDFDPSGQLWIVSRVLSKYDLNSDEFESFSGPEYFTTEYGRCIAVDSDGTVWVGSEDKGLYRIEKAASFTVIANIEQALSCTGNGKDAALLVKIEGGKAPFTYQWSPAGLSGNNPKNLAAGMYTVTVTDVTGVTKTAKVEIENAQPKLTVTQKRPESDAGKKDGIAELQITGGAKPFQIAWSNGASTVLNEKLSEGFYSVTVTGNNGCTATSTVQISQNVAPLSVTIQEQTNIKCNGGTGTIRVDVDGGKGPFQYRWNNPALQGDLVSGIAAGAYQLTVTDAKGNSVVSAITLQQPEPILPLAQASAPAGTGKSDGKALAEAKGGTGKYSFAWDNGEKLANAVLLSAGKHNFTVTDANGCTAVGALEMRENVLPLSVTIQETGAIKCAGQSTMLKAMVNGGKAPFQFKWSIAALNGDQPDKVPAGLYTLTVTDALKGTATASYQVKQPDPLEVQVRMVSAASTGKNDGKAAADSKGGSGKYIYAWDSGESTANALKLGLGRHTVTLTDANGCSTEAVVDMKENVLPLSVEIQETESIKCNGGTGSLRALVSGGKGPYQWNWNEGAGKTEILSNVKAGPAQVSVTDAVGNNATANFTLKQPDLLEVVAVASNPASTGKTDGKALAQAKGGTGKYSFKWDNGETLANAVKLTAGTHRITLTDANNCSASTSVEIAENIQPLALRLEESGKIKCAGQTSSIKVVLSGGKPPFQYSWNNAALKGESPEPALAGIYQLTVTDAANNTASASLNIRQPQPIAINAMVVASASTGNADGKANITALGGVGRFEFAWDNGENTANAVKLAPGRHSVTVTDGNGCTASESIEITENILPLTLALLETGSIKCAGEKSGIKATVGGGKPPYQYKWNNPAWNAAEVAFVVRGVYILTVTDAVNKTAVASIDIKGPDSLLAVIKRSGGATTERSKDGWATVDIKGGTKPFGILWDNGETIAAAAKLQLGTHQVTITDANNCSAFASINIGKRILPDLTPTTITSGQVIKVEQMQFEADSARLTPSCYPVLDEVFSFLQENGEVVIEVGGHTSSQPSDAFADRLSTARAKAAADYLIAKGIDAKRVLYKGYGKRKPIASNSTPEGRKQNQRVEIRILEIKKQ